MKKKLLFLLCAILASLTAHAYAYFEYEYKGATLKYYKTSETTCEVTPADLKYKGEIIIIPAEVTYNGITYTVTSIGYRAFDGCSSLASVEIPNSVTSIGQCAFIYCSSLTSVEIPNSVTSIGQCAFWGCTSLKSVEIPNSVSYIGSYAFWGTALYDNQANWEYGVLYLGNYLINAQYDVLPETYTIKDGTTCIADGAFFYCSSLKSVEIPNSVKNIGEATFSSCYSLTSVEIPNSVTSIVGYVFHGCSSLTSIEIPDSVTSIGDYVFCGCSSLTSITVNNANPANISLGYEVFYDVPTSTCTLYVPKGSKELYATADQWNGFKNIVEFDVDDSFQGSLIDGEVYDSTDDKEGVDVTYTRKFNNTNWQPLYVPFNMSYEEWSEYADVAELNDVHQFDGNDDGDFDDPEDATVVEFRILKSGEINPNIPYLIRAKAAGEICFEGHEKTLLAAPEQPGNVWCTNTHYKYTFTGNYVPVTNLHELGAYAMSKGNFYTIPEGDTRTLNPNRAYLTIDPINVGYGQNVTKPSKVRVSVDGEMTDGIDGIVVDSHNDDVMYDLTGRKVANPRPGIYIQNGKKVIIK